MLSFLAWPQTYNFPASVSPVTQTAGRYHCTWFLRSHFNFLSQNPVQSSLALTGIQEYFYPMLLSWFLGLPPGTVTLRAEAVSCVTWGLEHCRCMHLFQEWKNYKTLCKLFACVPTGLWSYFNHPVLPVSFPFPVAVFFCLPLPRTAGAQSWDSIVVNAWCWCSTHRCSEPVAGWAPEILCVAGAGILGPSSCWSYGWGDLVCDLHKAVINYVDTGLYCFSNCLVSN